MAKKATTGSTKITLGNRRKGYAKKRKSPKEKNESVYRGQGR